MRSKLKALLAIGAFVGAVSTGPAAMAEPNPNNGCMLHSGCFWDSEGLQWICADPGTYALCDEPQG